MKTKSKPSAVISPAPTGRTRTAQGKERSDAALGDTPQNTSSPEGATELGELPKGWRWVTLRRIAEIAGGVTKGQKRRPNDKVRRVPYLRVANVQRGYLDLTEVKEIDATEGEIEALRLQVGDILFNEGGDRDKLGRGWVWNGEMPECVHQNHVFRARLRDSKDSPKFISYYGNSAGQSYFYNQGKHTTNLASINLTKLGALPIPLPPPDEQRRIVAEIEKQFTRLEAGVAALRRVQANLKRYRAAVLKAACEGRLVPTEAELHRQRVGRAPSPGVGSSKAQVKAASPEAIGSNPPFESGKALLTRILAERRRKWHGRGKYQEPETHDTTDLPCLPESWIWANGAQLFTWSSGEGLTQKEIQPGEYPVYGGNGINGHHNAFVAEIPTVVIGRVGALCGNMYLTKGRAWITDNAIYATQTPSSVSLKFVAIAFNQAGLNRRAAGSGQPFVNQRMLNETTLPLPPLTEQMRIVAEVERRLSVVEELESVVTANLQRATRIRQSILQKAFTGKL